MEHTKKMALVEPRLLDRLLPQQPYPVPSTVKALNRLDEDMERILRNPALSQEDKIQQYQQVLQRYLTYQDQYRQSGQTPAATTTTTTTPAPAEKAKPDVPAATLKPEPAWVLPKQEPAWTPPKPEPTSEPVKRELPKPEPVTPTTQRMTTPAFHTPIVATPSSLIRHLRQTPDRRGAQTPDLTHTPRPPREEPPSRRRRRPGLRATPLIVRRQPWTPY